MATNLDRRHNEHANPGHQVVLGGVEYDLPGTMPLETADAWAKADISRVLETLFGVEHAPVVLKQMWVDDLAFLIEELYDVKPGEAPAS